LPQVDQKQNIVPSTNCTATVAQQLERFNHNTDKQNGAKQSNECEHILRLERYTHAKTGEQKSMQTQERTRPT